jgi:hypothetical protein
MRDRVTNYVLNYFDDYRKNLMEFSTQNPITSKEKIPLFVGDPLKIDFPNLK